MLVEKFITCYAPGIIAIAEAVKTQARWRLSGGTSTAGMLGQKLTRLQRFAIGLK